jgi:hypothetical protein
MIYGGVIFVCSLIAALILYCLMLGIGGNLGFSFGYYGKYNRVTESLKTDVGVRIVDSDFHHDVTLEDFTLQIVDPELGSSQLEFSEAELSVLPHDRIMLQNYLRTKVRNSFK